MNLLTSTPRFIGFAPIDLKDANVVLLDGFGNGTESPTVAGIEAQGATVIEITNGTMEKTVPVSSHLRFAGDNTKYRVTARALNAAGTNEVQTQAANTATGGTFNLTFTIPASAQANVSSVLVSGIAHNATSGAIQTAVDAAFAGVAIDNVLYAPGHIAVTGGPVNTTPVVYTFSGLSVWKRNWPLIVEDDTNLTGGTGGGITETTRGEKAGSTDSVTITPTLVTALVGGEAITFLPQELDVKIGEGTVTYDENREIEFILDRGKISDVRLGDESPMDVTLDFTWEFLSTIAGATTPSIEEALRKEGPASTWVSTNPDPCAPFSVDVEIRNKPPCASGNVALDTAEVIRLPQFYFTQLSHDADAAQVSITGQCNALKAIKTRTDVF